MELIPELQRYTVRLEDFNTGFRVEKTFDTEEDMQKYLDEEYNPDEYIIISMTCFKDYETPFHFGSAERIRKSIEMIIEEAGKDNESDIS